MTQIRLKPDTTILGAYTGDQDWAHPVQVVEDSAPWPVPLWLYRSWEGPGMAIIAADTWEQAYYARIDAARSIDVADLPDAFGCWDPMDYAIAEWRWMQGHGDGPDLAEGYQYQDNAGDGTGIVYIGDSESLEPLTHALVRNLGLTLRIGDPDLCDPVAYVRCLPTANRYVGLDVCEASDPVYFTQEQALAHRTGFLWSVSHWEASHGGKT